MSQRLWDKGGVTDAEMLRYTARNDWQLDERLLIYDLRATLAHVRGLFRIGILAQEELRIMEKAIEALLEGVGRGDNIILQEHEDGHSAIESALTSELGELGKKVHTGRSRNDQVLVALRLYERDEIDAVIVAARTAAQALVDLAEREAMTPMPGYTHLQRAVPSSLGLWAGSFAEQLADAIEILWATRTVLNRSPLGGAAGYGVNLPLDRDGMAEELGFSAVALNPMASQASRGAVEVQLLASLWQVMAAVRRLCWDLSLFTTSEFGFVTLDESLTTGSSIMPNKKNPDVIELMRAACAVVEGAISELMGILSLPSGYHRDMQLTKAPLFRAIDETLATTRMVPRVVAGLSFDRDRMRAAISPDCFATDRAIALTTSGIPFREAYRKISTELDTLKPGDADASLKARMSPGAPGALHLDKLRQRLATASCPTGTP